MYAVIFTATLKLDHVDEEYSNTSDRLRALAFADYNCQRFECTTEGDREIAVSYWSSLEDIREWKNDPEHQAAQQMGKDRLYESWQVKIAEVINR